MELRLVPHKTHRTLRSTATEPKEMKSVQQMFTFFLVAALWLSSVTAKDLVQEHYAKPAGLFAVVEHQQSLHGGALPPGLAFAQYQEDKAVLIPGQAALAPASSIVQECDVSGKEFQPIASLSTDGVECNATNAYTACCVQCSADSLAGIKGLPKDRIVPINSCNKLIVAQLAKPVWSTAVNWAATGFGLLVIALILVVVAIERESQEPDLESGIRELHNKDLAIKKANPGLDREVETPHSPGIPPGLQAATNVRVVYEGKPDIATQRNDGDGESAHSIVGRTNSRRGDMPLDGP